MATDSWDAEGKIISICSISGIKRDKIIKILNGFIGEFNQTPPVFSAKKINGRPAYYYMRHKDMGLKEISLKSSVVKISDIKLLDFKEDKIKLKISCGTGTYIRSIAHEIGRKLGCGAILIDLIRTKAGKFDISSCLSVDEIISKLSGEVQLIEKTLLYNKCIIPVNDI